MMKILDHFVKQSSILVAPYWNLNSKDITVQFSHTSNISSSILEFKYIL